MEGDKACNLCRDNLLTKIENTTEKIVEVGEQTTKRLDAHAGEIKELTALVMELAGTNKQLVATQELLIKNLEAQEKRVKTLEDTKAPATANTGSQPTPWYTTNIGEWAIKAAVIAAIIVLGAAIGRDILKEAASVLGGN